ncbi:hypothetical protein PtA15_15A220 [Puccinia triticina]|uniref:Uncharacterized protein n=1 Tax=Puccinia triticina TaxID=208348 RepID=A0ABY7D5F4_9BASI|nr:uncharacterized protein PtA15_15A220 [Puccinia triticina]WAQ91828.1 hypothetical protein PtA15_15A220 [Puccinia triticina]
MFATCTTKVMAKRDLRIVEGAVDRIRLWRKIDLDTWKAPAMLSLNWQGEVTQTANLLSVDSDQSVLKNPTPHKQHTQFAMQFNFLPAFMLIVVASAVLEATAVPIANIMRVKGLNIKTLAKVTTNSTAGTPVSNKQMAKGFGW